MAITFSALNVSFPADYRARVMSTETLVARFQMLPPSAQKQVEALVEGLAALHQAKPRITRRFKFDWAGGLEDLRDQFTSVERQHHINTLR